jgi:hypothetical protein
MLCLAASLTVALSVGLSGTAMADSNWAGADPSSNYLAGNMPSSCSNPTSAGCINAAVAYLDAARASLGQPPYSVPSNFDSLSPDQQVLVLANLERLQYGLIPIQGVTAALNQDAAVAMKSDTDPQPSAGNYTMWTANWAGGAVNMPMAYEIWMYDDGAGSGNIDCTTTNTSGCWGHRHDVLWTFDTFGPLAMGAAAGLDNGGGTSYSMLAFEGDDTYTPAFTYTWAQAVAKGANGGVSGLSSNPTSNSPGPSNPVSVTTRVKFHIARVSVKGHRVTVDVVAATGNGLSCALSHHRGHRWTRAHFRSCRAVTVFSHLSRGRYRLRVRSGRSVSTRSFRVR